MIDVDEDQVIAMAVALYGDGDLISWPKALGLADFMYWELDLL